MRKLCQGSNCTSLPHRGTEVGEAAREAEDDQQVKRLFEGERIG
jgi:hypothetical protein